MTKLDETVNLSKECDKCYQKGTCGYFKAGSIICGWATERLKELDASRIDSSEALGSLLKIAIFETEKAIKGKHPDAMKYLQQTSSLAERILDQQTKGAILGNTEAEKDKQKTALVFACWRSRQNLCNEIQRKAESILVSEGDKGKTLWALFEEFKLVIPFADADSRPEFPKAKKAKPIKPKPKEPIRDKPKKAKSEEKIVKEMEGEKPTYMTKDGKVLKMTYGSGMHQKH